MLLGAAIAKHWRRNGNRRRRSSKDRLNWVKSMLKLRVRCSPDSIYRDIQPSKFSTMAMTNQTQAPTITPVDVRQLISSSSRMSWPRNRTSLLQYMRFIGKRYTTATAMAASSAYFISCRIFSTRVPNKEIMNWE